MSKPEDIPQDVWNTAEEAAAIYGKGLGALTLKVNIARAILAAKAEERESAALYVESMSDALYEKVDVTGVNGRDDAFGAWIVANVADAIRKRLSA